MNNKQVILHGVLCGLLALCLATHTLAQQPFFKAHQLIQWNDNIKVQAILQDQTGYVWLGTPQGLFRFNGYNFQAFTTADSLAQNAITALAVDAQQTLWAGHQNGLLTTYNGQNFTPYTFQADTPQAAISSLLTDSLGNLWVGTQGDGIYIITTDTTLHLNSSNGLADDYIYTQLYDTKGCIWVGTDAGIHEIDFNTFAVKRIIDVSHGLPDNIVQVLEAGLPGQILIGMQSGGVWQYSPATNQLQPATTAPWSYGSVKGISITGNEVWVATARRGIVSLDPLGNAPARVFNPNPKGRAPRIHTIMPDHEGNIWLGTQNGAIQSPGSKFGFLQNIGTMGQVSVQALSFDASGQLWFCTQNGLYSYVPGTDQPVQQHLNLPEFNYTAFISLHLDAQNHLWIGTYGQGVIRMDVTTGQWLRLTTDHGLVNGNVLNITSHGNAVWLATLGGVSRCPLPAKFSTQPADYAFTNYTTDQGLANNYVYHVFADSHDRLWFGTDGGGLSMFEQGQFSTFDANSGLNSSVIYSTTEDRAGHIWFSTVDDGIYRYNGQTLQHFGEAEGIRDLSISALFSNSSGEVIVAHRLGLDVFNPETGAFSYYGSEVGIAGMEPNLNAVTSQRGLYTWVGTNQGIIRYAAQQHTAQSQPRTYISQVLLFQQPVAKNAVASLHHKSNNLTFRYTGFWFQSPENVGYQVKLDNYDIDWIDTRNRQVTYSSLPPGSYTFRVRAAVNQQFANAQEKTLAFTIRLPYWQTPWFYAITILVVLLLFYGVVKYRERSLKEARQRLERKVEERTREVRQQKEEIEKKNQHITSSINYARRIQQAILPLQEFLQNAMGQHFILYKPRDIVSGDFYWCAEKDDRVYIAAVDCTGHGVPGAFMSMIGSALLNEIVNNHHDITPAQILDKLQQGVTKALKQDQIDDDATKARDGMDLSLCCIHRNSNLLEFAGAKRPLYVFQDDTLTEYKGDKYSIGGNSRKQQLIHFTNHQLQLHANSTVYLFSDGYPDQFGGSQQRKFMTKQFKRLLHDIQDKPLTEQKKLLHEALENWKGTTAQTDDVLVIGFKPGL